MRRSAELLGKKSAVVSAAGTLLLSGIATQQEGDAVGFAKGVNAVLNAEPGSRDTGSAEGVTSHFGPLEHPLSLKLSVANEETSRTFYDAELAELNRKAPMPWALEFSDDPQAGNTEKAERAIEDVFGSIGIYKIKGYDVLQVYIRGYASDEDNSAGGGLRTPSKLNRELADTRANAVEALVSAELKKIDIDVPILRGPSKEIIDRKLDKRIDALAKERGMTTLELVQKYNRDKDAFSQEDLAILNGLADDRFVNINVSFMKPPVVTEQKQTDGGEIIIVPFLLPLFRFSRRPHSGRSSVGPTQTQYATGFSPILRNERQYEFHRQLAPAYSGVPVVRKQPRPRNFSQRGRFSRFSDGSLGRRGRSKGGDRA